MNRLISNYHTHTYRCNHADGTDHDYVEAAIKAGIKILGFSDHTPMIFPYEYHSGHRIPLNLAEDYFDSIRKLKEEYKDDIEIHVGVELEYYPNTFEKTYDLLQNLGCEYMILGQHFLWDEKGGTLSFDKTTDENTLTEYYKNVLEAVETDNFKYIAHPDVLNFVGDKDIYEKHTRNFFEKIEEKNIPLEINRLGKADNRNYPNEIFWKICSEYNIKAIVGLDAHSPKVFEDSKTVDDIYKMAEELNIEVLDKLDI